MDLAAKSEDASWKLLMGMSAQLAGEKKQLTEDKTFTLLPINCWINWLMK